LVVGSRHNVCASTVHHQDDLGPVWYGDARLPADLDGDRVAARGVVVDKVQLLVGWHNQVARGSQGASTFNHHVSGNTSRTVRHCDNGVCAVSDCLGDSAGDGLFNQRPKVGVGRCAPCTGLVAGTNQLNT
jgi:hypothetical protein